MIHSESLYSSLIKHPEMQISVAQPVQCRAHDPFRADACRVGVWYLRAGEAISLDLFHFGYRCLYQLD